MKLLVLGSSNSIGPSSYVGKLALPGGGLGIVNRSIGASSSTAGLYAALSANLAFHRFDIALIDYEINEEGALSYGLKTRDDVLANMTSLFAILRGHGVTPVVMIMPTTRGLGRPTEAERLHLDAAEAAGVHHFNIAALFRSAHAAGAVWGPLMRDDFHMAADTTGFVAEALGAALGALTDAPRRDWTWEAEVVGVRTVAAPPLMTPERRVHRRSGHRESWHALLRQGKTVMVPIGAGERLLAVVANSGGAGGVVEFRGAGEPVRKQLVIYFGEKKAGAYITVVSDLRQPLRGTADGMAIELLPSDAAPTEPTLHQQPPLPGRYGEVEIEAFLVADAAPTRRAVPVRGAPDLALDLTELVDRAAFDQSLVELSRRPPAAATGT